MSTAPNPNWHWPRFEQVLCGTLTDRERMGLPDHYQVGRLDQALQAAHLSLRRHPVDGLLEIVSSPVHSLVERIAAGHVLAGMGDARIRLDQPEMCPVPGGEVQIGLPFEQVDGVMHTLSGLGLDRSWILKECPRHAVSIQPFAMARHPVTHAEYKAFLLDSGHPELPSSWAFRRFPQELSNHPVYTVSAASAQAYAEWLSRRTGRGFRLPTEAEWEWAAAGPTGRTYPWGEDFDADCANTAETGLFCSTPVGVFTDGASPFGLLDMAGNVEEYVADDYAAYPQGEPIHDHLVQIHGHYRVARGGSFARFRDLARTRRRHGHNPRSATYAMGFRLAETL